MPMRIARTPVGLCPACGYTLDAVTWDGPSAGPQPGDVCVCVGCAALLVYNRDLRPRLPTLDERLEALASAEVQTGIRAVKAAIARIGRPRPPAGNA